MPRTARASPADNCYHVLYRGNGRAEVFHNAADYAAFLDMPNHVHLVLRPRGDGDLGRWMQRPLTTHVRRYRRHHGPSGHVWQGRYKASPARTTTTS